MRTYKQKPILITGLDLGSTAIRIVVGQWIPNTPHQDIQLLGAIEVPSEGLHKGAVTSIDEAVSAIANGLEHIERLLGVPVEHVWVGISGVDILAQESKGVVAVAKPDGEITEEDVERVVAAARMVTPPLNYESIHMLPRAFTVDGQKGIHDPAGMTGMRLEVDAQIIYGTTPQMKNITKAVYRTGVDIDDVVLGILGIAHVVTTPKQRDLGVAVVDIGGSTTSVAVYEDGHLIHTAVIPIGSEHVTNDVAIGLKVSIDTAERVKLDYGQCLSGLINKKQMIDLSTIDASQEESVALRYIAEIIEARMSELLEKVSQEFLRVGKHGLLPAGVVFTGGGAKIDGLVDLAKEDLNLPATLGYPLNIQGVSDKVRDVAFAGAIGLVLWATQTQEQGQSYKHKRRFNSTAKVLGKLQGLWKSLIP
jgi:cell division protein FtsA